VGSNPTATAHQVSNLRSVDIIRKTLRQIPLGDLYRYLREFLVFISPAKPTNFGFKFFGSRKMTTGEFEPNVALLIQALSKSGYKTFIDIGAHHGIFTMLAAHSGLKCYAFEPDPVNYRILKRNISLGSMDNIESFNIGLGDKAGNARFFGFSTGVSTESAWAGSVSKRSFTARIESLDNVLSEIKYIASPIIMKIDVEGSENKVIQGAKDLLNKNQNLIVIVEITFTDKQEKGASVREETKNLINQLQTMRYEPFEISSDGTLRKIKFSYLEHLIGNSAQGISANLCFRYSE
jgi:FkbM family methyltransferase